LHEAIIDSLDHLRPWMPWVSPEPLELADREHLIADWLDRWDAGAEFQFGVFEGNALVGGCGLHRRVGPAGLEIGYWTRSGETGRGVATEAAGYLVRAAFSMPQIEFVEVHHDRANVLSGRVPQHLGFTLIEERDDAATAPAEVGVECVWRLSRRDSSGLPYESPGVVGIGST
jgi:ribosomal-protein-serine acetyltransferase